MNFKPLFDMGWAPLAAMFGIWVLILAAPLTILGETLVIWRFLPPRNEYSFKRSVKISIIMNVISGILGFLFGSIIPTGIIRAGHLTGEFYGATYYEATPEAVVALYADMMIGFCIISIIVEGIVLSWLASKSPKRSVWLIAVTSNLASYLGLLSISVILYNLL